MKSRITQEQFEQLTEQQHLAYVGWAVEQMNKTGDHAHDYRSISDLIQFIDERIGDDGWWQMEHVGSYTGWRAQSWLFEVEDEQLELIDALWEAVKTILEKDGEA